MTTYFDIQDFEQYYDFIKLYDKPFYYYRNFAMENRPYFSYYTKIKNINGVINEFSSILSMYEEKLKKTKERKDKKFLKNKIKHYKQFQEVFSQNFKNSLKEKLDSSLTSVHCSKNRLEIIK